MSLRKTTTSIANIDHVGEIRIDSWSTDTGQRPPQFARSKREADALAHQLRQQGLRVTRHRVGTGGKLDPL